MGHTSLNLGWRQEIGGFVNYGTLSWVVGVRRSWSGSEEFGQVRYISVGCETICSYRGGERGRGRSKSREERRGRIGRRGGREGEKSEEIGR